MQVPVQITALGLTLTEADERRIRGYAAKLDTFHPRLVGCKVRVSVPNKRPQGTPVHYNVRVAVGVPRGELAATRQRQKELMTAVQEAFRAVSRQLQDYNRKQRGPPAPTSAAPRGVVSRLNSFEGFGFLTTAEGTELYFHRNSVLHDGFDDLQVGDAVRYAEETGQKGPQASSVALVTARRAGTPGR